MVLKYAVEYFTNVTQRTYSRADISDEVCEKFSVRLIQNQKWFKFFKVTV